MMYNKCWLVSRKWERIFTLPPKVIWGGYMLSFLLSRAWVPVIPLGDLTKNECCRERGSLQSFKCALQPQYQKKCVQLALHICKFCIHRFNQPKIERKFSILESSKKQNLNLSHTSNSSHSFYIVLDTVTKLEMIKKMTYRRMCICYMQILCHFI